MLLFVLLPMKSQAGANTGLSEPFSRGADEAETVLDSPRRCRARTGC